MSIVVHVDLADEDLRKAVQEAIKGEIVSLTRKAIEDIIGQSVSEKLSIDANSNKIENMIRNAVDHDVKTYIREQMCSQVWIDKDSLNPKFAKLIRDAVQDILKRSLSNII